MNSYYTNRLEGEHARPSGTERALHEDYSRNAGLARRQRLAVAQTTRSSGACVAPTAGSGTLRLSASLAGAKLSARAIGQ